MTSIAARCRLLLTGAATVAATALLAAPAAAAVTAPAPSCPSATIVHPFTPWGDAADYFLAPNGGLEKGATGWALKGAASVISGNEPFYVGGTADRQSLRLPAASSATTAPFCIGVEHRTMRFFSNAPSSSSLAVDVLYTDAGGVSRTLNLAKLVGASRWAPTAIVPMVVNALAVNTMSVRLRFTPQGASTWTIDDVFIDPFSH